MQERPDVEILVDGQWCKSELRQWSVDAERNWSGQVNWGREVGHTFIDTFPRIGFGPTRLSGLLSQVPDARH